MGGHTSRHMSGHVTMLRAARLPRWALAPDWPTERGRPALADISIAGGRVVALVPHRAHADGAAPAPANILDARGAPVLPGLVEAHTHIDKTYTIERLGAVPPGLLAAIDAMKADRAGWTAADVRARADRALRRAHAAGVVHLRTHCDWWEPDATPLAWNVLRELGDAWADRLRVERVSLIPLHLFPTRDAAMSLARTVAASGPGARFGGFVHTTNWDPAALRRLFEAAAEFGLDVDLHVDEELDPAACGLDTTAALLRELRFDGRVVCGHDCALAAQPLERALSTLDAVARAPITMVSLPTTNLLLQDARPGRTPRQRGITLVKEARERGIPVLVSTDNVQDAFCRVGAYDPVEALATATLAAQLDEPFDAWSDAICRHDRLAREPRAHATLAPGDAADFVIFDRARAASWPADAHERRVLRAGALLAAATEEEPA